jgi:hypothetical protein
VGPAAVRVEKIIGVLQQVSQFRTLAVPTCVGPAFCGIMRDVTPHHSDSFIRRRPEGAGKRDPPGARAACELLRRERNDPQRRGGGEAAQADRLECDAWNAIM